MACSCMVQGGNFSITNLGLVSSAIQQQTAAIAQPAGIAPLRFCHWAAPEWGDSGETWEKTLYKAALIAVALLNTAAQLEIAEKRYQLAKDYANIASDKWNRFWSGGYRDLEQAMLFEVGNTPIPTPNYAEVRNTAPQSVNTAFSGGGTSMSRYGRMFRMCIDASVLDNFDLGASIATDDGINFGYRKEEWYAKVMEDVRFSRRSALLNIGRDNVAESAKYADAANGSLSALSALAGQGASGAVGLLGYLSERNDTVYPSSFAGSTQLGGSAGFGYFPSLFSGANLGPDAEYIDGDE